MSILVRGMKMPNEPRNCKFYDIDPMGFRKPYCKVQSVCNGLEDCPLEENNDNWISVKERLPAESGNYLIVVNGTTEMDYYSKMIGWDCEGVTHWMPLPEPPKEADE